MRVISHVVPIPTTQPSPPLANPLTIRSNAAASSRIFLPPPQVPTTARCRLRLNSAVPIHGPSCPVRRPGQRPRTFAISPLSVLLSARPTCRTDYCALYSSCYPYRVPTTPDTYALHFHLATFVHFAPYCPHPLRRLTYRPRPVSYFRPVLTPPILPISPRRAPPPCRPPPPLRSQYHRMRARICH